MDQLAAFRDTIALARFHDMPEKPGSTVGFAHLRSMLDIAESGEFSESKLGRWLGWAQCAVVAADIGVVLDDMKYINRAHSGVTYHLCPGCGHPLDESHAGSCYGTT
ncbi:hypothetical protein FHT44_005184 [Mycolicibacterium sp. BK634]|uniref:hypothetical protein n=1 Tax=Mycolicibacterium sp. BK634 TaxID=2587099 RepID=UPI00161D05DA|nr:hypothetical protein [Mycolicibacterium sp. BK634]MBB3752672.1 hypothetical protein [Mycolicibacterium sp. BK634]